MADSHPTSFPNYPRPVLGDYGSARLTYDGDTSNCFDWVDATTRGYGAPEMDTVFKWGGFPAGVDSRLTFATNVWQIGQTIRAMMRLERNPEQTKYSDYPDDKARWVVPMNGLARAYSRDLINVVAACLDPVPDNRPTPAGIISHCATVGQGHLKGMADPAVANLPGKRWFRLRHSQPQDDYRVGMMIQFQ